MYRFFSLVLALCVSCTTGPTGELKWDATIGSMGVPQSPSATPTFPATITPPVDGDALSAPQLNIDVETKLQNGVEAARLQNYGGGIQRRVKCTGSGAGALTIQPLGAIAVTVAGQWTVFPDLTGSAGERVTSGALNPTTLAGGALSVSTRYWVYAFGSGGKIDFIASTVAPDAGLRYSSAPSTDYLYVSTFVTDSAGAVTPYAQSGTTYWYNNDVASDALVLLSAGSALAPTAVPTNFSVPAGATSVCINVGLNTSSAGRYARIRGVGGGVSNEPLTMVDNGAVAYNQQVTFGQVGGTGFEYFVSNAATTLSVLTCGFML